ncbi:MAG: Protein phosphatase methylesterase 1 [Thelocarpon impressellum]|nr:MAG: Protein phosphatase methylesterase 1 [Thelocarpon impressellum]
MSDLQRSFIKAKLAHLPPMPPEPPEGLTAEEREDEEAIGDLLETPQSPQDVDVDDSSSPSSTSSVGTVRPLPGRKLFARPKGLSSSAGGGKKPDLEPLPWSSHFDQELYLTASSPTQVVTHHVYITPPASSGPLLVTHHGAGSSGLSFAVFTSELRKLLPNVGILSLDARGHGDTVVKGEAGGGSNPSLDLSLETLSSDLVSVVRLTQEKLGWTTLPDILLMGHSLGGAVVTNVASQGKLGEKVLGYVVLDVVEGSAIDALQSMQTYLSTRPSVFDSLASGIDWHIRSRTIRNAESARTSVPALLMPSPSSPNAWLWRTNLASTQPFWEEWFLGLSGKFLGAKGGKLLLLAGTDRLDKPLMIGQMQGKYQLHVFPEAGHFIHEDQPAKTAMAVADFYKRNDRSAMVMPPKVADLLKLKGHGGV